MVFQNYEYLYIGMCRNKDCGALCVCVCTLRVPVRVRVHPACACAYACAPHRKKLEFRTLSNLTG